MWKARGNHHIIFPSTSSYEMEQQNELATGNTGTLQGVGPGRRGYRASQAVNKRNPCTNIATWNVRTMLRVGKVENIKLEMEKNKINVLGLSETRWKEEGEFRSGNFHVVHSGSKGGQGGVALVLDKSSSSALLDVNVINHRLMSVRLTSSPVDVVIIQVYMPTSGHDVEELEESYSQLEDVLRTTKAKDNVIVMGDWNACVGEEPVEDITGRFGLGRRNDRGQRLINFCQQERYVVTNTYHEVPYRRRYTWKKPGDHMRLQLDYILVKKRYRNQVKKSIAYPGADINSDHNLVKMSCNLRWKRVAAKGKKIGWNLEALKQPETKRKFQGKLLANIRTQRQTSVGPEGQWQGIKLAIKDAAASEIGPPQTTARKQWVTAEVLELIDERRKWKNVDSDAGRTMYRKLKNEVDRTCKKARETWWNECCEDIERFDQIGRPDLAYRAIKQISHKNEGIRPRAIRNKEGVLVLDPEKKKERWIEYVEELYSEAREYSLPKELHQDHEDQHEELHILREEFMAALASTPDKKAPGIDEIPIELIKEGGAELQEELYRLINNIYMRGEWPEDHQTSVIIPLPKRAKAVDCEHFRTISLVSHASKILLKIIKRRMEHTIDEYLASNQFGFRKMMGTRDAIGSLRFLGERLRDHGQDLYVCFVDYEKAFDRVPWHRLFPILEKLKIDRKIIKLIWNLYSNQKAIIALKEGTTPTVNIRKGVRQGCLLSPDLFNVFADLLLEETINDDDMGIWVNGERISAIKYADDQAILASSEDMIKYMMRKINEKVREFGMKINFKKTKIMLISRTPRKVTLSIDGNNIQQETRFCYLGQIITEDLRCESDITARLALAKKAFREKYHILASRNTELSLRKRILKAYVWSTALYAAETWTLTKKEEKQLEAFEMWCYRKMQRISWTERKSNERVLEEVKEKRSLLKAIRRRRMSWMGHTLRHECLLRTAIEGCIHGRRGRGRPRRSYVDQLCDDAGVGSYYQLKRTAEDRQLWRTLTAVNQSSD